MSKGTEIGATFVARRKEIGLTQRELGDRIGVAQPQVARWEKSCYRTVPLDRMRKVADALGMDLHAIRRMPADRAAEARAAYIVAAADVDPLAMDALRRTGADLEALRAFCRLRGIKELALFGSVLTEDFGPASDVDVLVTYAEGHSPKDLATLLDTERALRGLLHRDVDLVERRLLERSENYIRRKHILDSARPVHPVDSG